jgi:hypothetical protein
MTQDEIIEMARQAGMAEPQEIMFNNFWTADQKELEAFAKLVAAKEREACAKLCETYQDPFAGNAMADAIRARGEA